MSRDPVLLVTGATRLVMSHVVRCWLEAHPNGRAVAALLDCAWPSHEIYNIAYGETTSLRELAELVTRLVPGTEVTARTPVSRSSGP